MFYTNCMSYNEKDVCVCPVMARANHSCRPNAEFISRVELGKDSPSLQTNVSILLPRKDGADSYVHD